MPTLREKIYEQEILPRAQDLVKNGKAATKQQAIAEVIRQNPELYEAYRSDVALLPAEEALGILKRRQELGPFGFSGAVSELAKILGKGDLMRGLEEVRKSKPVLWNAYCREAGHPQMCVSVPTEPAPASKRVEIRKLASAVFAK